MLDMLLALWHLVPYGGLLALFYREREDGVLNGN